MNTTHKKGRRRALFAAALVIIGAGLTIQASPAAAVDIVTGANATKSCPDQPFNLGDNIPCLSTFTNTGNAVATVVQLSEQSPWPGGPTVQLSCTIPGVPTPQIITVGSSLAPGAVCSTAFLVHVPNDPALCNTFLLDRVEIALSYPRPAPQTPLQAGANATNTTFVQCLPSITVDKTADGLSKVGDDVNYSIEICNTSLITVNRVSVVDTLVGDIAANFPAALAPGACATYSYPRTVQAGDPDQLVNEVTAVYSGFLGQAATASDDALTNLFQPGVSVTKTCGPSPLQVGETESCEIIVSNTSSADAPALNVEYINDSLSGDLLNPANVVDSDCGASLATGASCTIHTARVVQDGDPSVITNTVDVRYHPDGFPNNIDASATATVVVIHPSITASITASPLSKVTDDVTYVIEVCNTGDIDLVRDVVSATLLGSIPGIGDLLAGECQSVTVTRTVQVGDADPLIVDLTVNYSGLGATASATSGASTELFQPGVDVTKTCAPNPITVGQSLVCTIHITNTSSADAPDLTNGTITDSLYGDLLAANTAVTSNTCTGTLATGATCEITTAKVVATALPNPLVNTVTVHYNPAGGFTNDITDSATASVVVRPPAGTGCTPGFWKQSQKFYAWVGYVPSQTFLSVFGRTITITVDGKSVTNPTLLQALNAQGGGINALARFAVNGLLNGSSTTGPDFTVAQVIAIVQSGIDPGGLTVEEAHQVLAGAPGVVNDNCKTIITKPPK